MGADLIGWRGCSLQRELGPQGFLEKHKLVGYRSAIESHVAEDERDHVKVRLVVHRPQGPAERELSYSEIKEEADAFERGCPECASCPLGGGAPVGCFRYVRYPIDAASERELFERFAAEVDVRESVCRDFYDRVIARVPDEGTGWHERRGSVSDGALAELAEPLSHNFGGWFTRKRFDSAQLLLALLNPQGSPEELALFARLHERIARWAEAVTVPAPSLVELAELAPFYDALARGAAAHGWELLSDT